MRKIKNIIRNFFDEKDKVVSFLYYREPDQEGIALLNAGFCCECGHFALRRFSYWRPYKVSSSPLDFPKCERCFNTIVYETEKFEEKEEDYEQYYG